MGKRGLLVILLLAAKLQAFAKDDSSFQNAGQRALCELKLSHPDLSEAIPTAVYPPDEYLMNHHRGLSNYNHITGVRQTGALSLLRIVPRHGTVMDIGGGAGFALAQMLDRKLINGVLINTQAFEGLDSPLLRYSADRFKFEQGFAQVVLPKYVGQADLALDIFGAFMYSPNKAELFEMIYNALKPGGQAFIVYHPELSPAWVRSRWGFKQHLSHWLQRRYPEFVDIIYPVRTRDGHVIHITKPLAGPMTLTAPLEMTGFTLRTDAHRADGTMVAPVSWFRVRR